MFHYYGQRGALSLGALSLHYCPYCCSGQLKASSMPFLCREAVLSVGRAPQLDRNTPLNVLFMALRILRNSVSKACANGLIPNKTSALGDVPCIYCRTMASDLRLWLSSIGLLMWADYKAVLESTLACLWSLANLKYKEKSRNSNQLATDTAV